MASRLRQRLEGPRTSGEKQSLRSLTLPARQGAVSVWLLLALTAVVGVVALGLDGGRMLDERRRLQAAADAAALAAANELYEGAFGSSTSQTRGADRAAASMASTYGYTNDGKTSIVTVNVPPQSGSFQNQSDHVEVILQSNLSATFGRIFTGTSMPVKARAVARGRPSRVGLLLLRPSGADAFHNRAFLFTSVGAPIVVNSSDPAAFHHDGLGIEIANSFEVTGGIVNSGGIMLGRQVTGVAPTADPLRFLPVPSSVGLPVQSNSKLTVSSLLPRVLSPGVYQGGIEIAGLSTVVMLPGTYLIEGGGLKITGLSTVLGIGVFIYNGSGSAAAGPITIDSLGRVALVPPTNGTYQGIGIFQERASAQPIAITGMGLTAVTGLVYAPSAPVALSGIAAVGLDTLGGAWIASSMTVTGVGSLNIDLGSNLPRIPDVVLVE